MQNLFNTNRPTCKSPSQVRHPDDGSGPLEEADRRASVRWNPVRIEGTFYALPPLLKSDFIFLSDLLGRTPPTRCEAVPRVAYIHFRGPTFEFDHHLQAPKPIRAYAFLSFDLFGQPNDIVAWNPATDGVRSWLGVAWAWGEETLLKPRLDAEVVPVWRSPVSRIRADLDGFVLIRTSALSCQTLGLPALSAEDAAHRTELSRYLQLALPRVLLRREVRP